MGDRRRGRRSLVRLVALGVAAGGACGGGAPTADITPKQQTAAVAQSPAAGGGAATQAGDDPAALDDSPVDYQEVDLPAASNFLPLLKVGAEGIGCALVAEQPDGLAYQCKEGLIFMVQKGATLRYACEDTPDDQCGALMTRITDRMLQAAGG